MAAGFSILTYIGRVLAQAPHYHGAMISVALLVFGVASVADSTLGGRLTDCFGAFPVVVGGLAALTLAMPAVSAPTAATVGWLALLALAAWGLGGWRFPPCQQHRLVATAPEDASVLLGLNSSAIYAGAAIGERSAVSYCQRAPPSSRPSQPGSPPPPSSASRRSTTSRPPPPQKCLDRSHGTDLGQVRA